MALVQYGETCYIDGVSTFTSFMAEYKSREITSHSLKRNNAFKVGKSDMFHGYETYALGKMKLLFYVYGETRTESEIHASALVTNMNKCVLTFSDDEFEYPSGVISYKIRNTGIDTWSEVTVEVECLKRGAKQRVGAYADYGDHSIAAITNPGTLSSGAKLYCDLTSDSFWFQDMEHARVTATGLTQGAHFEINGWEGTVTQNNQNAYQYTDLLVFPTVVPGYNEIYFSQTYSFVEYYPLYLL